MAQHAATWCNIQKMDQNMVLRPRMVLFGTSAQDVWAGSGLDLVCLCCPLAPFDVAVGIVNQHLKGYDFREGSQGLRDSSEILDVI